MNSILYHLFAPRGLGRNALVLGVGLIFAAVVGLPMAFHFFHQGRPLGETGQHFFWTLLPPLFLLGFFLCVSGLLILNVGGLSDRLEARVEGGRRLLCGLGAILSLAWIQWGMSFLADFTTRLGPGPQYYEYIDFLGKTLLAADESFTRRDFFTVAFLLVSATLAGDAYLRVFLEGARLKLPGEVFGLFAVGFVYLAMDEYFCIHEFLGGNLPGLRSIHFVGHPDDAVMLAYFVAAGLLLLRYLPWLLRDRVGLLVLGVAFGLQGVAAVADAWFPANLWLVEELCEVASAGMYVLFVASYARPAVSSKSVEANRSSQRSARAGA
jgi:hypothetical protein